MVLKVAIFVVLAAVLHGRPLRDLGERRGIRMGAAVDPSLLNQAAYSDALGREYSQVEPGNTLKFGPIHPAPTSYNLGPPDSILAFAQTHRQAMRGHTPV